MPIVALFALLGFVMASPFVVTGEQLGHINDAVKERNDSLKRRLDDEIAYGKKLDCLDDMLKKLNEDVRAYIDHGTPVPSESRAKCVDDEGWR